MFVSTHHNDCPDTQRDPKAVGVQQPLQDKWYCYACSPGARPDDADAMPLRATNQSSKNKIPEKYSRMLPIAYRRSCVAIKPMTLLVKEAPTIPSTLIASPQNIAVSCCWPPRHCDAEIRHREVGESARRRTGSSDASILAHEWLTVRVAVFVDNKAEWKTYGGIRVDALTWNARWNGCERSTCPKQCLREQSKRRGTAMLASRCRREEVISSRHLEGIDVRNVSRTMVVCRAQDSSLEHVRSA
ncbi:hypothetical protein DOTSEDRAFT_38171 [Dothistroma septosporum NZE10]|uniref:Uncharacterized protein n=1 Tax=Dothistroma septosporum (strain NZE10 / CBS 128990) TaxID=675120 RepID=N1PFY2_DOTSN|nr:hypothetical protein DOTSEDRAFT_38171 [Dothistroma septosporum NZE10]